MNLEILTAWKKNYTAAKYTAFKCRALVFIWSIGKTCTIGKCIKAGKLKILKDKQNHLPTR